MIWKLDKRFINKVRMHYERFDIRAGILQNGPHYAAKPSRALLGLRKNLTEVAGMPARKRTRTIDTSLEQLSRDLRKKTGVNVYTAPFKGSQSAEIKRFRGALVKFLKSRNNTADRRKAEQLLVEAIRTPIKRRRYGPNSAFTIRLKSFNRLMFDTGQFYMAIKAKITRLQKGGRDV